MEQTQRCTDLASFRKNGDKCSRIVLSRIETIETNERPRHRFTITGTEYVVFTSGRSTSFYSRTNANEHFLELVGAALS